MVGQVIEWRILFQYGPLKWHKKVKKTWAPQKTKMMNWEGDYSTLWLKVDICRMGCFHVIVEESLPLLGKAPCRVLCYATYQILLPQSICIISTLFFFKVNYVHQPKGKKKFLKTFSNKPIPISPPSSSCYSSLTWLILLFSVGWFSDTYPS